MAHSVNEFGIHIMGLPSEQYLRDEQLEHWELLKGYDEYPDQVQHEDIVSLVVYDDFLHFNLHNHSDDQLVINHCKYHDELLLHQNDFCFYFVFSSSIFYQLYHHNLNIDYHSILTILRLIFSSFSNPLVSLSKLCMDKHFHDIFPKM